MEMKVVLSPAKEIRSITKTMTMKIAAPIVITDRELQKKPSRDLRKVESATDMGLQFALTMITIMVRLYIATDNYAKKNGRLAADAIQPRACQKCTGCIGQH